jgi:ribosomal-protein-alanine N-acetyltransferase
MCCPSGAGAGAAGRCGLPLFLEVRVSNTGAIALYREEGFDVIGVRNGYYPCADANPSRREDALMLGRALED